MKQPRTKLYIGLFELLKNYFKILLGIDLYKGEKTFEFEKLMEKHWKRKKCFTLSTARLALYYVLKSLKLNKGDEVLLSPFQIPDFINVILKLNLKPVFVEIDTHTKCLNISDLKKKITNKSKVILATYLTGIVPDIKILKSVCDENGIFLIEDISQSYGSMSNGINAGSFGFASIGSFSPAKIISSIGGGFILIDDSEKINYLEQLLREELFLPTKKVLLNICLFQIKVSLATSKYVFAYFTYYIFLLASKFFNKKFQELHNPVYKILSKDRTIYDNPPIQRSLPKEFYFYFTDFQAKIAIRTFQQNINFGLKKRRLLAKILYDNLSNSSKKHVPKIITNYDQNCFWHFPIIINSFDVKKFQSYLMSKGYDVVGYALRLCSSQSAFKSYNINLEIAQSLHQNTLFLPLFDTSTDEDMRKIAQDINKFFIKFNNEPYLQKN